MDWSNLSQDVNQWRTVVNAAMKIWIPQKMNFYLANRASQRRCFSMELR